MNDFPAIHLLLRHRRWLAMAAAAIFFVMGLYLTWRTGYAEWAVTGAIFGAAIYPVVKSYLELLQLITDMLLPR
jgi:hypothetical protein